MKKLIAITLSLFCLLSLFAQENVGIGTSSPNSSAQLEIKSSSKGLLMPRLLTAERNAIANPATGLMVFDLDKNCFYFF